MMAGERNLLLLGDSVFCLYCPLSGSEGLVS